MLGVGIVGCGRIAQSHAAAVAALANKAQLVAVADPDAARAAALAQTFSVPTVVPDLTAMLALPQVQAVILCTPNKMHAAHSIEALAAGRHVLVEKPMAENSADARRMAASAQAAGRVLVLGQTMRHTAPIRYLQDHRADFGRLRAVEVSMCVRWNGPQTPWWRTRAPREGLILSLFAPHALDFVQLAIGEQPLNVRCEAAQYQTDWRGEDEAMILLRYPRGCLASVHISYNQSFVVDRKTLHFENAFLRIENGDDLWIDDRHVLGPSVSGAAAHRMGQKELGNYFTQQLQEFLAAVRGEPHRSVLPGEGVRLTELLDRVIDSGYRSWQSG